MEEIGRRLEAARLMKGITLQDVEDETRIRKKYVAALEAWRLTDIPGDVYVKGFLRTYGNFLGLDGEALVEEYKSAQEIQALREGQEGRESRVEPRKEPRQAHREEPKVEPNPAPNPAPGDEPRKESAPVAARPLAGVRPSQERPPRRPAGQAPRTTGQSPRPRGTAPSTFLLRRAVVAGLVVLPLVGVGWWLYGQMSAQPAPPPVTQREDPPPEPKPPEVKAPEPEPEPPKPTVTMTGPKGPNIDFAVSTSPVTVQIEGFREGFPWVQVIQDGKEVFQGKLSGPVSYSGKEFSMIIGFGQGVDLVINGEKFALPAGGAYTVKIVGQ